MAGHQQEGCRSELHFKGNEINFFELTFAEFTDTNAPASPHEAREIFSLSALGREGHASEV
jgi:hypothetical protein